jgi:hypothetical protein
VATAHGRLPVPAPATLRLLSAAGAPTRSVPQPVQVELVTPTAAALLAEMATWGLPTLRLEQVGYGFGARDLPWPNAVRVWIGQAMAGDEGAGMELEPDEAVLLECNLDDTTGEALGYAMERLMAAGALDVWFTPIQMKKNRPAVMLSVLAAAERAGELALLVLRETSTLGVRRTVVNRLKAGRELMPVQTPWGAVRVKVKSLGGRPALAQPEYEDCAQAARRGGVPLLEVYAAAQAAAQAALASLESGGH